jgi:hypothetical protein
MKTNNTQVFKGYLMGGIIYDSLVDVKEFIDYCIEDWVTSKDSVLHIPDVINGMFIGEVNENRFYVGIFRADNGKTYEVSDGNDIDCVKEVA